ncbi:TPA: hypothetical protein ACHK0P_003480 [Escherichia coli]
MRKVNAFAGSGERLCRKKKRKVNAFAVSLLLYLCRALGMFFVISLDLDVLL